MVRPHRTAPSSVGLQDSRFDLFAMVEGKSNADMVAAALGKRALKGEATAYCALRDTTEGRPAQTQQHEIISSSPVKVRIEAPDLLTAIRQIYGLASTGHE